MKWQVLIEAKISPNTVLKAIKTESGNEVSIVTRVLGRLHLKHLVDVHEDGLLQIMEI